MWKENELSTWCQTLKNGEITAAPAEGVYGYCADPFNKEALTKLNEIKKRNQKKGFIILLPNTTHLKKITTNLSQNAQNAINKYWNNPQNTEAITILLPASSTINQLITGNFSTIAVRIPKTAYMQEYMKVWGGPLISTSLNTSGKQPATNAKNIPQNITSLLLEKDLIGQPSKIYNPEKNEWLR